MSPPWEKYGGTTPTGPWERYATTEAPQPGDSRGARLAGFGALGFNDSVAGALGMPVDAAAGALRSIIRGADRAIRQTARGSLEPPPGPIMTNPVGGSQSFRDAFDYVATAPGRAIDAVNQEDIGPLTEPRTARAEPQDRAERIAYGAGKGIGGAATSIIPAGAVANMAPAGSVTQAVARTLAARPVMQGVSGGVGGAVTEDTGNPWYGLAAAAAVPTVSDAARGLAKRALTPTMRLTPDEQRIAAAATARDIPLTPAQATGSRGLQVMESTLRRLPVAGNLAERGYDQQRQALNREITQLAGGASDRAGPDVIDRLYRTAGQSFDDLITRQGQVNITPQTVNDVAGVVQNYGRRLPTDVARTFNSYIDDLAPLLQAAQNGQNPQVPAGWYQNVRSDLTRRLRGLDHGDPLHDALMGLRNALDDSAARTRPDLAPDWQALRGQYANLSTLDKAMRGAPAADASAGNVPLGQFRNAVRSADPEGFARGRGDMNELAQIAGFLQNRVPNSGTPERGLMTGLLAGGGAFEPTTAAAAVAIPTAVQAAYGSAPVRQFLTTPPGPFMGDTPSVVRALMLQRLAAQLQPQLPGGAVGPR